MSTKPAAGHNEVYRAAVDLGRARDFNYLEAPELAARSTDEILERVESLSPEDVQTDSLEAKAALGGASKPGPRMSEIFELYKKYFPEDWDWKPAGRAYNVWEKPHTKVVRWFIEEIGDLKLDELTEDHFLEWKEFCRERTRPTSPHGDPALAASVNKDTGKLRKMWGKIDNLYRLGLDLHSRSLMMKLEEGEQETRPPFSEEWIEKELLKHGALDGLNDQAKSIMLILLNTGARPSEIDSLREQDIVLDANVPYINITPYIRPDGTERRLKTKSSKRKIPLAGLSLEAARRHPKV